MRDLVILPHIWEHYNNITHQTLEATRAAALDPAMTHLLKVPRRRTHAQALHQCRDVLTLARPPDDADLLHRRGPWHCRGNSSGPEPPYCTDIAPRWTTTPMCGSAC